MGVSKEVSCVPSLRYEILMNTITSDLTTKALSDTELTELTTQKQLAEAWSSIVPGFPQDNLHVLPSIEHVVNQIKDIGGSSPVKVLVAGSLHLVGGMIEAAGLSDVAL